MKSKITCSFFLVTFVLALNVNLASARWAANRTVCRPNEIWRNKSCDQTCSGRSPCTRAHRGCFCKDGFFRDRSSMFCVPSERCPSTEERDAGVEVRALKAACDSTICNSICVSKKMNGGVCNGLSCDCNEYDPASCSKLCEDYGAPGILCGDNSCICGLCNPATCDLNCKSKGLPITGGTCSLNSATCLCSNEAEKCGGQSCATVHLYTTGRYLQCTDPNKPCFDASVASLMPCVNGTSTSSLCNRVCLSSGRGLGVCGKNGSCSCRLEVAPPKCPELS